MSLIDFTANLFRNQQDARAFADNPMQALRDAGLSDVTPEDVQALLPTVAESMPPDHPLQSLVQPAEQSAAQTEPVDPAVRHYYQLQPGDQVIDGVAGQTIMRPDGTNVTLDNNDVILQPDEKVYVMQPGDQAIPGINGMVIEHSDGSMTDVGIDTTIVDEEAVFVGPTDDLDPRLTTTPEDLGGGLDPRVTTTAEDLGGDIDPNFSLEPGDPGWTPYDPNMPGAEDLYPYDPNMPGADNTAPTQSGGLGLGEDPRDGTSIDGGADRPIVDDTSIETETWQPIAEELVAPPSIADDYASQTETWEPIAEELVAPPSIADDLIG